MVITETMLEAWLAELPGKVFSFVITIAIAVVVLWLGHKLVRPGQDWAERLVRRAQPHDDNNLLVMAVRRIVFIAGIALTVVVALGAVGVDVGALMTALGLTTVALGFALKDTVEQAVTGLFLLLQRPFKVGDVIEVDGIEGTVEDIAIRTTNIHTFDGLHVLIPNNKVFQGTIRNKSYYKSRRWTITLGIAYDGDLPKAHGTIVETVNSIPGVLPDPAPTVAFEGFDAGSVRAVVRYWIEPSKNDPLAMQSIVVRTIIDAARAGGIAVPYPVQPPAVETTAMAASGNNADNLNKTNVTANAGNPTIASLGDGRR